MQVFNSLADLAGLLPPPPPAPEAETPAPNPRTYETALAAASLTPMGSSVASACGRSSITRQSKSKTDYH